MGTEKGLDMSVWFITGASRGFGLEITREALCRGDSVVATARNPQAVHEIGRASCRERVCLAV